MKELILILEIPLGAWLFWILGASVLFLFFKYPHKDWVGIFLNFFKIKRIKIPEIKTALPLKRPQKTKKSIDQLLCERLNQEEAMKKINILSDDKKIEKLREYVFNFIKSHKYVPNGDIRSSTIDFNMDKHYRIILHEEKWVPYARE